MVRLCMHSSRKMREELTQLIRRDVGMMITLTGQFKRGDDRAVRSD